MARSTSAALGRPESRSLYRGSATTLSQRYVWPEWSIPGTPTGMKTSGSRSNCMPERPSTMVGTGVAGGAVAERLDTHTSTSASPLASSRGVPLW